MATYEQIYDIWDGDKLKKEIVIAILKAAQDILNEDLGTTDHANRIKWANAALNDPYLWGIKMSVAVITSATIQSGTYTDGDVQYLINSAINTFADNI